MAGIASNSGMFAARPLPRAYNTFVRDPTLRRMPSSGVTGAVGSPL